MEGTAESSRGTAARVSVSTLDDGRGVRIDDRIERRQCELRTGGTVSPTETDGEQFRYPIDVAVTLSTDSLTIAPSSTLYVHEGRTPTEVEMFQTASFPRGTHAIELSGPLKLYLVVEGPFDVEKRVEDATVQFDEARTVAVGARSYHERPAATVTTTDDPSDLARAVSTFGSALKTTGSDRAYPTLRGHPPALEVGEALSIPKGLDPPASDVRIAVPSTLEAVCTVGSLAYYLGCPVEIGSAPTLVVDDSEYCLSSPDGFGPAVERVLKRTFFLDCLVRTAGPRRVPQYERRLLEPRLDVDVADLYEQSAADRLKRYMEVPYERVVEHLPTWKVNASIEPSDDGIESLPFLANDLAVIDVRDRSAHPTADEFARSGRFGTTDDCGHPASEPSNGWPGSDGSTVADALAGATDRRPSWLTARDACNTGGLAGLGSDGPIERAWIGEGVRPSASKAMPEAFRNRLGRMRRESDVEIVVVCNDPEMLEEQDVAREVYGSRKDLPFDVTFYDGLRSDQLELVLESDVDYLHYIGHVDDDGFECTDGTLDARTLDTVAVDVVFLNACRSYEQGVALIERGAVAGVVTQDDVINSGAVRIGKTMARLLNLGFPLRSALNIAKDRSIVGSQYLLVGDGNADISQARGLVPVLAAIESTGEGTYRLDITTHPTRWAGLGSQFRPALEDCNEVFLAPGRIPAFELSATALEDYLATGTFPVVLDGEFTWSDDVDLLE